jgi:type VII secretion-associated serine protease mycosin
MIGRALIGALTALVLVGVTAVPAAADTARNRQWYLTDLNIAKVHQVTRGEGSIVALIDTGVDAKHRDLTGAVLPGRTTLDNRWVDGTASEDHDGHGTNMAGIIAGRGHGSGDGVLGIAPAAKILPIGAPINGLGSSTFMTVAVDFAIVQHAGVINMSFGRLDDETMHDAIRKAQAADIVLVTASGNRGDPGDYPGKYPEVLTVGAYGQNHEIASFSIIGPQVDLAAPGDQIVTTSHGPTDYDIGNGTSEAAAMVSGAAALIRAKYPRMSAAEVVHRLTATAEDTGPPGRDDTYGYGRLDIVQALTADVAPLPAASAPAAAANDTAAAAPSPTSALDTSDLPKAASPLLLAVILAGIVLFVGAIVIAAIYWRRRQDL